MSGRYRPARDIRPGWHVRLAAHPAAAGEWMPVRLRIDTVTDDGRKRIWLLGEGRAAVTHADARVFARTPDEIAAARAGDGSASHRGTAT
ncbi:hypothetical protein GCM10009850_119020 [Nonomuraea monospora]|uniref:Uncharacterized protein n=1 Tax=Nonomuraea monospora TaxID=568818 RepID=A0ABP5PXN0_9ACTN